MANDAPSKSTAINNPTEGTSLSSSADQQKVPPLRIVLNTSSNQKSSQQAHTKREKEKAHDVKLDGSVRVASRVRIRLGANRQSSGKTNSNETRTIETFNQKGKNNQVVEKVPENINEDSASSFSHLRRITRRSQRAVQSISNEDDESISSMTSTDENQQTNNNQLSSEITTQDSDLANSTASTLSTVGSATNNGSNTDTPRRYKRRKVESNDCQSIECDSLLTSQNYKLPNQNSFELFKNIRKQVDKKLRNLSNVNPRTPYGFRDYMLTRKAYLLDGNKLGNGTNLFMNEDGGLNTAPLGKYHAIRKDRTNYSVPNRAKVPLGLPVNSPLYDLFVEQEKERYRMRMQHIKEREKLTLTAEQEIMRVYNQAALAAVDQSEPFSACTMLKHQEIYNYMDSDGITILSREDEQHDQPKPDGVRTRRRQHGHISPSSNTRKGSDAKETDQSESKRCTDQENQKTSPLPVDDNHREGESSKGSVVEEIKPAAESTSGTVDQHTESTSQTPVTEMNYGISGQAIKDGVEPDETKLCDLGEETVTLKDEQTLNQDVKTNVPVPGNDKAITCSTNDNKEQSQDDIVSPPVNSNMQASEVQKMATEVSMEADSMDNDMADSQQGSDSGPSLSEEDKRILSKDVFLGHLQETDDKWERIRHEMLKRHKNEAESLHAIQRLEWEWKTKEIGACDIRTTPIIDDTLVPKLSIYSQDY